MPAEVPDAVGIVGRLGRVLERRAVLRDVQRQVARAGTDEIEDLAEPLGMDLPPHRGALGRAAVGDGGKQRRSNDLARVVVHAEEVEGCGDELLVAVADLVAIPPPHARAGVRIRASDERVEEPPVEVIVRDGRGLEVERVRRRRVLRLEVQRDADRHAGRRGADRTHGQAVGDERVVRCRERRPGLGAPGGVLAGPVAEVGHAPRLVDRDVGGDPVA